MPNKPKFKSDAFEAIHSSVSGMYRAGTIDKTTMRHFDETCFSVPPTLEPAQIKSLRESNHVSQHVFARYLNTSDSTVEKWETGAKRPSGMALKLLEIVQKHGLQVLNSLNIHGAAGANKSSNDTPAANRHADNTYNTNGDKSR